LNSFVYTCIAAQLCSSLFNSSRNVGYTLPIFHTQNMPLTGKGNTFSRWSHGTHKWKTEAVCGIPSCVYAHVESLFAFACCSSVSNDRKLQKFSQPA